MSSEAPPPTDTIASAPEARYASMPFSASLSVTSSSLPAPARFSSAGSSRMAPRPWTIRVGKDMTEGIGLSSDDLEVPLQLPLRHRGLELAAFPVAGAHVVVDEGLAQELADLLAARERLGGGAQRRRERLRLRVVAVPHRLGWKRHLVLHAVQ